MSYSTLLNLVYCTVYGYSCVAVYKTRCIIFWFSMPTVINMWILHFASVLLEAMLEGTPLRELNSMFLMMDASHTRRIMSAAKKDWHDLFSYNKISSSTPIHQLPLQQKLYQHLKGEAVLYLTTAASFLGIWAKHLRSSQEAQVLLKCLYLMGLDFF